MSENIRTRDSVEHVPQQNSLPKRANRGGQARRSASREAQPQKEPATIRLPDLPQIPPYQQMTYDEKGCRELMAAMILQSVEDVDLEPSYQNSGKNEEAIFNQRSAVHFLRSVFFSALCLTLGLAGDQIRKKAFSTKPKHTKHRAK
jgi:hypothetical protein